MTAPRDLGSELRNVLIDAAPRRAPESLYASVMASTATARQRPGLWATVRTGATSTHRRTRLILQAVLIVALVAALVGSALLVGSRFLRQQDEPLIRYVFTETGSMGIPREGATALPMADGRILVVGGTDADHKVMRSAEVYDPTTGQFTATGDMLHARAGFTTMTLLADGTVLVDGGCCNGGESPGPEIYDPSTGTFTASTIVPAAPRTIQAGGQTLIPVGSEPERTGQPWDPVGPLRAIGFEPPEGTFAATELSDGRWLALEVLRGPNGPTMGAASIYDPASGTLTAIEAEGARHPYPVAVLRDGRVLLVGDLVGNPIPKGAELFDPATGTFESLGPSPSEGPVVQAIRLPDGRVLLTFDPGSRTPELFDPVEGTFILVDSPLMARSYPTIAVLDDGQVLITGGTDRVGANPLASAELYRPPSLAESP